MRLPAPGHASQAMWRSCILLPALPFLMLCMHTVMKSHCRYALLCLAPPCLHRCAELPAERINELFMLPMPANQQRAQQQRPQQLPPAKAAHQKQQQQPLGKGKQPLEQAAAGPAAAPAGGSGRQEGQLQWPRRQLAGGGAGPAAGDAAGPSSAAAAAAAAAGAADTAGDSRTTKRARRAEERAYNEAVIGDLPSCCAALRCCQAAETDYFISKLAVQLGCTLAVTDPDVLPCCLPACLPACRRRTVR